VHVCKSDFANFTTHGGLHQDWTFACMQRQIMKCEVDCLDWKSQKIRVSHEHSKKITELMENDADVMQMQALCFQCFNKTMQTLPKQFIVALHLYSSVILCKTSEKTKQCMVFYHFLACISFFVEVYRLHPGWVKVVQSLTQPE